jgi:hypothetical protein
MHFYQSSKGSVKANMGTRWEEKRSMIRIYELSCGPVHVKRVKIFCDKGLLTIW